ncbi:MAG TPA: oligosaccharide flippase family protein [Patescibacteria group bacterium]|nr:oligosaccharide flippase family protein [Patescibacteria group bacterium]
MEHNLRDVKSRSFLSVSSLMMQTTYSAVLGFAAFLILTIKSGVYLLGIYNTVLAMMAFFNYFTNLGLAAAIVQKKDVEEKDLHTAFLLQFALSIIAVAVGFSLTNKLFVLYPDLPRNAVYLYWSVLASFFLLSLKTIPSILLEKKIQIYKVVLVQAVENTVFYLLIIIFSLLGFEIFSLIVAVLFRSLVGIVMVYILQPWSPRLIFSPSSAKALLSYGIPFQGNSFLALVKDDLLIMYLGSAIGLTNLGYVTFAKKYAEFSIRIVVDNFNRVSFPLFARFQKEKELLTKSMEKVLFYESLLIFPAIVGVLFVFESVLKIIPGYFTKWGSSLFSFYFFSFSAFFITLTTPFINLFNAIGKVKLSLYFMIMWTAFTWILVPVGIKFFGPNGISIAFFIQSLSFIFVIAIARRYVQFSFENSFKTSFFGVSVMFFYLLIVRLLFSQLGEHVYTYFIISVIGGALIYFFIVYKRKGNALYREIRELLKT